jgi:hypothetical protein
MCSLVCAAARRAGEQAVSRFGDLPMAEREFDRPENQIEAVLELDGKQYRCEVVQLSFNGALLRTDAPAGRGDTVELDFDMIAGEQDLWVHLGGQVIAREERLVGVEFWEMDLDSLGALRQIISSRGPDGDVVTDVRRTFTGRRIRHGRDGRLEY